LRRSGSRHDDGSAAIEFVVVVPLLILVVLAIAQVTLALYVRSTIASAAAEGARVAATSTGAGALGERRTRDVLGSTLADGVVDSVTARPARVAGVDTVEIVVRARLPLVGLLGPSLLVVRGHALREP
jgi:hypothetical protein